jgi:hypothetical protein
MLGVGAAWTSGKLAYNLMTMAANPSMENLLNIVADPMKDAIA